MGAGAVGARLARSLVTDAGLTELFVEESDARRATDVLASLDDERVSRVERPPTGADAVDVVILAHPTGDHVARAEEALVAGSHVVSTSDDVGEIRALLALQQIARRADRNLLVGAAFSPGVSCLLAVHAAAELERVDEVHVARVGVGGPACERQQQRALHAPSLDWRDGAWSERPGGAGRELCYFPDPIGGVDCFRAARPEAMLLVPLFSDAQRVTARLGTQKANPLRAKLFGRRRVPSDGSPGAIRVELRGPGSDGYATVVLGCMDRASVAASALAAEGARVLVRGEALRPGAGGAGELLPTLATLQHLADAGVRAARFEGTPV